MGTYKRLLQRVVSFDDTAEAVIERLLDQTEGESGAVGAGAGKSWGPGPARATPGSVLPIGAYWRPILRVLADAGGAAATKDVIDALGDQMAEAFTPLDCEPLRSGQIRWRSRARFARLRMKERGLLSDKSPPGVWEITDLGRRFLEGPEP